MTVKLTGYRLEEKIKKGPRKIVFAGPFLFTIYTILLCIVMLRFPNLKFV